MEAFCKVLYKHILESTQQLYLHERVSIRQGRSTRTQVDLTQLPHHIREEITSPPSSGPSTYAPDDVIQKERIDDVVTRVTRVIPETGTRIDIFFMSGSHCRRNINYERSSNIVELYVRVLERMAPTKLDHVEICLLPTKHPKRMNMRSPVVLSASNVNSGVTIRNMFSASILVYRHEEMFKVLLHELMHLYQFDYFENQSVATSYTKKMSDTFKVESRKLALNESFNDAMTLVMYLGFVIALKRTHALKTFGTFYNAYRYHYAHMRQYLIKMSAKLTLYAERHHNGTTKEITHVFAYYHGKAALLSHAQNFFQFINRNNYHIPQDSQKIAAYIEFLKRCLRSRHYREPLALYKEQLEHSHDPEFDRSLRMCNFDLDM